MRLPFASPEDVAHAMGFFDGYDEAHKVWHAIARHAMEWGPVTITSTKSRVALKARTRFLWCPQAHKSGTLFVRFWFPEDIDSPRLRRDQAANGKWSHRVRVGMDDLDDEVLGWFRAAYEFDVA